MDLEVGMKGSAETVVKASNTAKAMGSGQLEVFATPALVALMEEAAVKALKLPQGQSSVGTSLEIKHTAASPIGTKIIATAELMEIDRRRLVFQVEARDEAGQIGAGKHERFIIDVESFLAKAQKRKQEL